MKHGSVCIFELCRLWVKVEKPWVMGSADDAPCIGKTSCETVYRLKSVWFGFKSSKHLLTDARHHPTETNIVPTLMMFFKHLALCRWSTTLQDGFCLFALPGPGKDTGGACKKLMFIYMRSWLAQMLLSDYEALKSPIIMYDVYSPHWKVSEW